MIVADRRVLGNGFLITIDMQIVMIIFFSVVLVSVEKSSKHERQYVMDISRRFLHCV